MTGARGTATRLREAKRERGVLLLEWVIAQNFSPVPPCLSPSVLTPAELSAFVPDGHHIVMMLDAKSGCRLFTSPQLGDSWEHEVLIPAESLIRLAGCAPEFASTQRPSCQAA